jgi:hypothetical protein
MVNELLTKTRLIFIDHSTLTFDEQPNTSIRNAAPPFQGTINQGCKAG